MLSGNHKQDLPAPMPVFVVYETAYLDINGTLQFPADFYHRDTEIWRGLESPSGGQNHIARTDDRSSRDGLPILRHVS